MPVLVNQWQLTFLLFPTFVVSIRVRAQNTFFISSQSKLVRVFPDQKICRELRLHHFFRLRVFLWIPFFLLLHGRQLSERGGFHAREKQKVPVRAIVEGDLFLSARSSSFFFFLLSSLSSLSLSLTLSYPLLLSLSLLSLFSLSSHSLTLFFIRCQMKSLATKQTGSPHPSRHRLQPSDHVANVLVLWDFRRVSQRSKLWENAVSTTTCTGATRTPAQQGHRPSYVYCTSGTFTIFSMIANCGKGLSSPRRAPRRTHDLHNREITSLSTYCSKRNSGHVDNLVEEQAGRKPLPQRAATVGDDCLNHRQPEKHDQHNRDSDHLVHILQLLHHRHVNNLVQELHLDSEASAGKAPTAASRLRLLPRNPLWGSLGAPDGCNC